MLGGVAAASAAVSIQGHVEAGGAAVAGSTVTLWAASAAPPRQVAQAQSGSDGSFVLPVASMPAGSAISYYVVASGGTPAANKTAGNNPAIGFISVLGNNPPGKIVVNELTTVASVWTNAQLVKGTAIQGNALSLSIAAGNVPNLVNLSTGSWGDAIQDSLNSTQTPTMANLGTLADILAGCATEVTANACASLFAAATPAGGTAPADTLTAAQSIAWNPTQHTDELFGLLNIDYPFPPAQQNIQLRAAPYVPYLEYAPSAWILALKFSGGGIDGPGKLGFDSKGDAWVGDNFIVGDQAGFQPWNGNWNGNLSELAPDGRVLSPMTTGWTGGGVFGPGFGTAIDAQDRVWVSNNVPGRSISVFDKNGQPLTPPDGITFNHQLGAMQGILVAPNGDVWILDNEKNQLVEFPGGDISKGKFICTSVKGKSDEMPCKLFKGPFHLAIDGKNQIWVSNAMGKTVVRFPESDPSQAVEFPSGGMSGKGMGIDSQGNVWVTNTVGQPLDLIIKARLAELKISGKLTIDVALKLVFPYLRNHVQGSVTMLRPDGSPAPASPFTGGGISGPWAIAVDGNDNIWVSNFIGESVSEFCGVQTDKCQPGMKTGDAMSPPGGFVGGGMSMLTDIDIDPAGDVWAVDNWVDKGDQCFVKPPEATSTQCGGNGLTVFYGMAKPVRVPQIGLPKAP